MSDWWTVARGVAHEQGDLLFGIPVPVLEGAVRVGDGQADVEITVRQVDAIVLTQTCDLQNAKIPTVLLARVVSWHDFAHAQYQAGNNAVKSSVYASNLIGGGIPPLALLHERTARPALEWSLADFRELYTVDRGHLDSFVSEPGSPQRLRLRSPYKEHVAQAFARFYMRVGLPHDARGFREAAKEVAVRLG